jgi:TRAP-type C4-dicarboxylate transport system permease small subunit
MVMAEEVVIECPLNVCNLDSIVGIITTILNVLAIAAGTIMIIIGGIQYMTSAGSEDKAKKAKQTILYAIIGIAVVLSVDFIIGLVKEILGGPK